MPLKIKKLFSRSKSSSGKSLSSNSKSSKKRDKFSRSSSAHTEATSASVSMNSSHDYDSHALPPPSALYGNKTSAAKAHRARARKNQEKYDAYNTDPAPTKFESYLEEDPQSYQDDESLLQDVEQRQRWKEGLRQMRLQALREEQVQDDMDTSKGSHTEENFQALYNKVFSPHQQQYW